MKWGKVLKKFAQGAAGGAIGSAGVTGVTGAIDPTIIGSIAAFTGLINALTNFIKHFKK